MQKHPESNLYYDCAAYPRQAATGNAHILLHYIIYVDKARLSIYPLSDGERYFLAVVGETPHQATKERIRQALSSGQRIELPTSVINELHDRHKGEISERTVTR